MKRAATSVLFAAVLGLAASARAVGPDNEKTIPDRARQMCDLAKKAKLDASDLTTIEHLLVRVELFYHRPQIVELGVELTRLGCDPHKAPALGLYGNLFAQPTPPKKVVVAPIHVPPLAPAPAPKGPQAEARKVVERVAAGTSPIRITEYTRAETDPGMDPEADFALALKEEDRERDHQHLRLEDFGPKALALLADLAAGKDGWGGKLLVEMETELQARHLHLLIRPLPPMKGAALIFRAFMGQTRAEDSFCFASAIGPGRQAALNGGAGTNAVVSVDVNLYETNPFLYPVGAGSEVSPLAVALGHELIHAYHMVTGTLLSAKRGDNFHTDEEALTIEGLAKVQGAKPKVPQHVAAPAGEVTENRLLAERGHKLRVSHEGQLTFTPRDHPALLVAHVLEDPLVTARKKAMAELAARLKAKTLKPAEAKAYAVVLKVEEGLKPSTTEERRAVLVREVPPEASALSYGAEYESFNALCELVGIDTERMRQVFGEFELSLQ